MAEEIYTYAQCEAAMCLWEAMLEKPDGPWQRLREADGTASMRLQCAKLAAACSADWYIYQQDNGDIIAFDWEFVPEWLLACVDWERTQAGTFASLRPEEDRRQICDRIR